MKTQCLFVICGYFLFPSVPCKSFLPTYHSLPPPTPPTLYCIQNHKSYIIVNEKKLLLNAAAINYGHYKRLVCVKLASSYNSVYKHSCIFVYCMCVCACFKIRTCICALCPPDPIMVSSCQGAPAFGWSHTLIH